MDDFVITDRDLAKYLEGAQDARHTDEKLLLSHDGDQLDIALFIEKEILERLNKDHPALRLHTGNLNDYWIAMEGVSHFLYVTWNASYDRAVSQLELEIQAEVDKYITTIILLDRQRHQAQLNNLHAILFRQTTFDDQMCDKELKRYQLANDYAADYCKALQKRYLITERYQGLTNELRRFYRLKHNEKVEQIRRLNLY